MQPRQTSEDLLPIWNQLMGLAGAVGDLRGRMTRNERDVQALRDWMTEAPQRSGRNRSSAKRLRNGLSRLQDGLSVLILLYKIWRLAPWGLILFGILSLWKAGWPWLLRWLGLS